MMNLKLDLLSFSYERHYTSKIGSKARYEIGSWNASLNLGPAKIKKKLFTYSLFLAIVRGKSISGSECMGMREADACVHLYL